MKHMKKRISCMILTATLLAGGSLEYAVAAEEQQNVSEIVTEEQVEIQSEEIVPQEEMVQTEEQAAATECQVVLETYTDGKLDEEHIGGTDAKNSAAPISGFPSARLFPKKSLSYPTPLICGKLFPIT